MLKNYSVEYSLRLRHGTTDPHYYQTDDPVACEEFVQDLLTHGMIIRAIRHNGADLPPTEFNRLIKVAASALAAERICSSLGINPEEERYRFGFSR